MAITLKGMTRLARSGLALIVIADVATSSPYIETPWPLIVRFALSYATAVIALLAFHRHSLRVLTVMTMIALTLVWSLGASGADVNLLLAAMAGALCGFGPAYLRDYQRLASGEDYLDMKELRRLRRRRADFPLSWSGRPGHVDRGGHDSCHVAAVIPDLRASVDGNA